MEPVGRPGGPQTSQAPNPPRPPAPRLPSSILRRHLWEERAPGSAWRLGGLDCPWSMGPVPGLWALSLVCGPCPWRETLPCRGWEGWKSGHQAAGSWRLQQPDLLSFSGHGWGTPRPTQTPRRTDPPPASLRVPSSASGALQPWPAPGPSSRAHVASALPSPRPPTVAAPCRARLRCPGAGQQLGLAFTSSSWSVTVSNTCLQAQGLMVLG